MLGENSNKANMDIPKRPVQLSLDLDNIIIPLEDQAKHMAVHAIQRI
jgi:hypothetical protein